MAEKRHTGDAEARRLPDSFRDSPSTGLGPCGWILVAVSFLFTVITFPISIWMCIKVIAAEGEMNASRALKEASMVITESPAALQLRYLQTLTTIAAEKNSTIVFPLPIDMLQGIVGAKQ
ncbi:PREDICTED: erythrocyte band 7 integral membrane protein isoform X2 [Odobenus rosmarus divergens]|uniref:Erythrocyte band 7 integral membrane protein isoform X2 n=1 Tax=Odobenus rosmarus divergens TaxID=9708 RepID=A0A2U3WQX0_ODORO|nr:PREDICTED: erythrocyte band 7 integral membrane protein isoform X2 [Odobenus rosmarus divergens]